jgi:hypothetical protein
VPRKSNRIDVGLVSLRTPYKEEYGNDLVAFAKGEITISVVDELTLKLFPWFGLLLKHKLSEDLINLWLGVHGKCPKEHFIRCNETAKSYTRMWIEDANIRNKIDFKKYASYMFRMFGQNVEPPKQVTAEAINMDDESFLELTGEED